MRWVFVTGEEESESVRWVLVNLRVDEESGRDKGVAG